MPRRKKRFARIQRFFKRYGSFFKAFITILEVILFVLQLNGQQFVIVKTVHQINLDVTDAYAHPSDSIGISVSMTAIVQNSSGTYTLSGK